MTCDSLSSRKGWTSKAARSTEMNALSAAIKHKRGQRSLREVAQEIGVDFSTIHRVERGQQPNIRVFKNVVRWLGISADDALSMLDKPCRQKSSSGGV